jgi:hypothetical protein
VPFDETSQQAIGERLHDHLTVLCLERVKGALVRERTVGHEDVSMRMQARHRESSMTVRHGLEHFLLQPLGPQELFHLLA